LPVFFPFFQKNAHPTKNVIQILIIFINGKELKYRYGLKGTSYNYYDLSNLKEGLATLF